MTLVFYILMALDSLSSPVERQAAESFYRSPVLVYAGEKSANYYFPETRTGLNFRTGKTGNVQYALGSYYFHPTLYQQRIFFGVVNGKFTIFVCDVSQKWDGVPKAINR